MWNAWGGQRWEAASEQLGAGPCSPRGKPGRRRPRRRLAAHGGHTVAKFAVLLAPGRVPRAGTAPDLVLAGPALASCMDDLDGTGQETPRAHAAPPRRSGVDRLSGRSTDCSARDNALSGTAMQKRRHPRMPVAARPGIFVHFSHVMNTTAPAAIPGRRPSSAGAAGAHIAHCTLHARTAPAPRPYRCRARNRAPHTRL